MARIFPTESLIQSEIQYVAIYQKSEKKSPISKMSRSFIMHNNNYAEKLLKNR